MPLKNPYFQTSQSQSQEEKPQDEVSQLIQAKISQIENDLGAFRKPSYHYFGVEEKAAIKILKESEPTDFKKISATILGLCNDYYTFVRVKSERTFSWTIRAYIAALLFFLASAVFFIINKTNVSYFTVLGTALTGLFGGLIQAHGIQVNKEAKECRENLDKIQRFIIANSACEGLEDQEKRQMRLEIIRKLVE